VAPATEKTSIAERILRIYDDTVVVPYAVEVDGHIITLFDPWSTGRRRTAMRRWIRAGWFVSGLHHGGRRAFASMLELHLDDSTRSSFRLPDEGQQRHSDHRDFGRQVLSPRDLLNRWIVRWTGGSTISRWPPA